MLQQKICLQFIKYIKKIQIFIQNLYKNILCIT